MKSRNIKKELDIALNQYPIIALTGPRQSGKTTFLLEEYSNYTYVNLENPELRDFAINDPKGFLQKFPSKIIFDEVQQAPELFSYFQNIVDESKIMGQFILSGSQNFQLMERISQSLAGRVAVHRLLPFDTSEMKSANWLDSTLSAVLTKGFYPAIFERGIGQDSYYSNYLETYVNRDVRQLMNIHDLPTFKRFLKLCALRSGQLLNISDLAKDSGVSHGTAKNWLNILETSFVIFFLEPYFENFGKRLVKSPKLYFYDVGLLCHLLDIRKGVADKLHPFWGQIFETFVVADLIKKNEHSLLGRNYYFWRDAKGHEVDILYKEGHELFIFEIKSSSTVQQRMFDGLEYFEKTSTIPVAKKYLIYGGNENQKRSTSQIYSWRDFE